MKKLLKNKIICDIDKTNDIINTVSIYLPFFDHGWWTVMVNKFEDTYTLYTGNKLYYDGYENFD